MPTLYILGGANGSGKTTWYFNFFHKGGIDTGMPFLNIDNIVLQELGSYTPDNLSKGEDIYRERMAGFLDRRESFMIESNLSKASDYEWIEKMKTNGYEIVLFFLGTASVDVNIARVKQRVLEGGHDVAESVILQRYRMGLSYLKSKILIFSEAFIIDSSQQAPEKKATLQFGKIIDLDENIASWITDLLYIPIRLQEKEMEQIRTNAKSNDLGL